MPASEHKATAQKNLPGIFISYRRSDNPDAVGRIYDRLVAEFGKARVFKDVDSIPLGQDFRGHLNDIVGGCAAVLAIIGPKWTDIRNEAGQKRLEDPDDFVRIELEAALARSVPVVPVLVGHAPMPGTSQLPSSLASLAFRQSIEVRPDPDFHNDATRLVLALKAIIDPNWPRTVMAIQKTRSARSWAPWLLVAATTLAAITFAIPALKYLRLTPPPETRIAIQLPVLEDRGFALSPDGRQIVYLASGDGQHRLWLRSLSATNSQPVPGTEGAVAPFWSPDSRSIAFFAVGWLKRLDLGSGQPLTLARLKIANGPGFGVWSASGTILFTSGTGQSIVRIAATGGPVTEVTKAATDDITLMPTSVLPDGQHFLFAASPGNSTGIYMGTLDGSPPVRLATAFGTATYLPSGWMLLLQRNSPQATSGSVLAQRLDLRNARLTGEAVSIAAGVDGFSAAATGLIAYRAARIPGTGQRQLTWVDRSGAELGTIGNADDTLDAPRVAPDGRRVVVSRLAQGNRDLWLLDGARASRLTFNSAEDNYPVWSPDGSRVTYTSFRSGKGALYEKLATGAGPEEELLKSSDIGAVPSGWSRDGRYLLYHHVSSTSTNISVLPKSGDRKPFPFINTPIFKVWAQFSPDGRWVAYQSTESERYEIFVRPFRPLSSGGEAESSADAAEWMVSTAGGVTPMWSANGKELYYLDPAGEMMAAPITVAGSAVEPGNPIKLFDSHIWGGGLDDKTGRQYDVAPDGRFLINRVRDSDALPTITLLQIWGLEATK